jgi:Uma2 family endonuclease
MATQPKTSGLTYDDLQRFPDDLFRREIIDGELLVTPAPGRRHQRAVAELISLLLRYAKEHGGEALPAPVDVRFSDVDVVEPDLVFVRADRVASLGDEPFIRVPPDLAVEVSSASTRRDDLTRKKALYERYGVAEYWFVDLDADRLEVYLLTGDHYERPVFYGRGEAIDSSSLSGLRVPVDQVLGDPVDEVSPD